MKDAYAGIADRYDLFGRRSGEHEIYRTACFRRLFGGHGVRRVLDCACGTGPDLALFHALGCQVEGQDLYPAF